jgi:hypothetical protein
MGKTEDRNTRYFIDLDLKTGKILHWDFDQRDVLAQQKPSHPAHHRIFLTKGQFHKLETKHFEISMARRSGNQG